MSALITVKHRGNFKNTEKFFSRMMNWHFENKLESYGKQGVAALASATPVDTGLTANSWNYEIVRGGNTYSIVWTNSNVNKGVNIALILQLGHGTRNGGYVVGRDYINPAIQPVFEKMANDLWTEVVNA